MLLNSLGFYVSLKWEMIHKFLCFKYEKKLTYFSPIEFAINKLVYFSFIEFAISLL